LTAKPEYILKQVLKQIPTGTVAKGKGKEAETYIPPANHSQPSITPTLQ
jgi:hypothetical protein